MKIVSAYYVCLISLYVGISRIIYKRLLDSNFLSNQEALLFKKRRVLIIIVQKLTRGERAEWRGGSIRYKERPAAKPLELN